ncbi:pre-B-cell leukemia homeobox interacting protein 1b isoform X2 [Melanotaenia boesemani]|uniref:pre-B-cell leukemia homeobox interacting protein 1b isoform X2 n=1 Tax=Melanotaenia boesemani TaxID=1250792 RepID=UPI001C04E41D|nr:pre-B-cell leukemia homeobox interacting protein 1b isoform X2 [Melanotaenia boesemani]
MSGGTTSNNSWTILTSEESGAETLRPFAAGTEQHEDSRTAATGSGENSQPANGAESAERLPVEDYLVSEETADHSGDSSADQHSSVPADVPETLLPSSLEASATMIHCSDEVNPAESLPEGMAQFSPDPDSSSDSYTLLTQSPDEPPASLLRTETLGYAEMAQGETLHLQNGEELHLQGEELEQYPKTSDLEKQTDSRVDAEVIEERTVQTGEQGESEERRKRSLLAALEQIGRREEEDEEEEEFQVPQRENDSGFSVNKCILGAVILLGLGTIFFSESDYTTRELKDTETPGQQEWLNPDIPPHRANAEGSELLNKLAEGNQQISVLQAQLQAQKEELKVAKGQAAEGLKERLHWEEVEKENSRLKTEMASLPFLQKENDRMKKELESVPALQKELETLRSTVTELKLSSAPSQTAQAHVRASTSPPTGKPEENRQSTAGAVEKQTGKPWDDQKEKKSLKRDKYEITDKKQWKEKEKSIWKEGEKEGHKNGNKKEWKKTKHEQEMLEKKKDKEVKQKKHSDNTKQWKEKDWKKTGKGDDGKSWKDTEGGREWAEKSERKQWKEDREWKKGKSDKINGDKQWRDKEIKDWQGGKDRGERHKIGDEWKEQKEWKKVKNGFKESGREKWERRDWNEKGEKKDLDWRDKNIKNHGKEGKGQGERKQQENSKNNLKGRSGRDERKHWNEYESNNRNEKQDNKWKKKDGKLDQLKKKEEDWSRGGQTEKQNNGDLKKEKSRSLKNDNENKLTGNHHHKEEHLYGDGSPPHTHHRPSVEQPEYWAQQRDRIQHDPRPPQQCDSVETCAKTERLLPVPLPEFEAILQTYLTKAEEAGVDDSKREALKKLTTEFFKDGIFVHNQLSFQAFAEDVGDILEDMVEGVNGEDEDSDIEDEMEEFKREVMKRFSLPGAGEKEEKMKGERRKEGAQRRG